MMRDDKLIELFSSYAKLETPKKLPERSYGFHADLDVDAVDDVHVGGWDAQRHAAWMATQAIGFIKEAQTIETTPVHATAALTQARGKARSKREKAHRWLGFIQATLWLCGAFTLDELKEHSRKCSDDYNEADAKDDAAAMDEDARRER